MLIFHLLLWEFVDILPTFCTELYRSRIFSCDCTLSFSSNPSFSHENSNPRLTADHTYILMARFGGCASRDLVIGLTLSGNVGVHHLKANDWFFKSVGGPRPSVRDSATSPLELALKLLVGDDVANQRLINVCAVCLTSANIFASFQLHPNQIVKSKRGTGFRVITKLADEETQPFSHP